MNVKTLLKAKYLHLSASFRKREKNKTNVFTLPNERRAN